ncbi:MAG: uracil-DNA glycosylase [Kiritimatiellaeota bacterium]|nr:uracil-DNA glycosylase [Kiritimatiellota bacterium]
MQPPTHPWHEILDDLMGHVRYRHENGERVAPGSPALLAALAAPPNAAQPAQPAIHHIEIPPPSPPPPVDTSAQQREKIDALAASIRACKLCGLCQTRKNAVPGQGPVSPDILFIDEAPAPEDDATGIAASPGAHQGLLPKMIKAMGYALDEVFITSLCKCATPDARRPPAEALEACKPHMDAQIAALKPRVIVLLGAGATMGLLKQGAGSAVAKSRGAWTHYNAIPVMPTYAPAHIAKFPAVKPQVWQDLQLVMKHLGKPLPKKA